MKIREALESILAQEGLCYGIQCRLCPIVAPCRRGVSGKADRLRLATEMDAELRESYGGKE